MESGYIVDLCEILKEKHNINKEKINSTTLSGGTEFKRLDLDPYVSFRSAWLHTEAHLKTNTKSKQTCMKH